MRGRTLACTHERAEGLEVWPRGVGSTSLAEFWRCGCRPFAKRQGWERESLDEIIPVRAVARLCVVASHDAPSAWARIAMGVAGAALILLLQELVDPTPLFWSAPWEALQLVFSRRRRVNHLWLHRTQDLARESIGRSIKSDGFAMADGFVVIGVGQNKQLVQWTAESACRGMAQEREGASPRQGCKAVRFLVAVWLMTGRSACHEHLARNRSAWGLVDRVALGCRWTRPGTACSRKCWPTGWPFQPGNMRTREDFVWKLSRSSFRSGCGGREARDLSCAEFLRKNRARIRNMSVRSSSYSQHRRRFRILSFCAP